MLSIIQVTLLTVSTVFIGYLAILSFLALIEKNKKIPSAHSLRRFAIIVPAYNEENGIARTVENLLNVNYSKHLFDVIVVADNCTDQTARISAKKGALVWQRDNPHKRGKGYALRWAFDKIISENDIYDYDSVVVVDADTIVSSNMLCVLNKYMEGGSEVIQGYLSVNPDSNVWTTEIIRIGFTLYNYVRPLGRRALGFSAGLRGNGMCFSIDILKELPWNAYSLTEDLEYGLKLLLNDTEVVFAPELIGYSNVPEDSKNAESQRERWEIGRYPILREYFGKLIKLGFKKKSLKLFDAFIDLVTPPVVNMLMFVVLMAGLSFLFWWSGYAETLLYMWLWLGLFFMALTHAIVGLYAAGSDRTVYKSLLFHVPKYALWKLYLYGKIFMKGRSTEWIRTARE